MAARPGLFADIDSRKPEAFAKYLAPDVVMRFGNAPPIHGRDACEKTWAGFCLLVGGVHHDVVNQWDVDGATTIAETEVTYTRLDGRPVTVPVVTVYRVGPDDLIDSYRVFLDLAPVFAEG